LSGSVRASTSQYSGPSQVNVTRVIFPESSRVTLHSQYSSCTSRLASARCQRCRSEIADLSRFGNAVQVTAARTASSAVSVLVRL
jgi:hypothetical protein